MPKNGKVLIAVADGVATLTLNRPEAMNSMDDGLIEDLIAALVAVKSDAAVRAVVLTGAGRAFCAGGDLNYLAGIDDPLAARSFIAAVGEVVKLIMGLDKPVIAMVNGVAAGAGFNLALACDIVFAARSARFAQSVAKVGLVPDCGGLYLLPRLVGFHKAKELMFTADLIDADTALSLSLINKVCGDEELKDAAYQYATRLAQAAPLAIGFIKDMINRSDNLDLETTLESETNLQTICMQSEDYREGVTAFKEKRPPVFRGK